MARQFVPYPQSTISSVKVIDSTHFSSSFPSLRPLVSFAPSSTKFLPQTSPLHTSCSDIDISISGHGLSVAHSVLSAGAGPLFDFTALQKSYQDGSSLVSTSLSSSIFSNVTRSETPRIRTPARSSINQKLLHCHVSQSTDHLLGTACLDMNSGGNLLAQNTSFSHCRAVTVVRSHEHLSAPIIIPKDVTLYSFVLCTFRECTSEDGGVIYSHSTGSDLVVNSSSFDSCSTPNSNGGGVSFSSAGHEGSVTITSCSFTNCSSQLGDGGSISIHNSTTVTVSRCIFVDCRACGAGGSILVDVDDPSSEIVMSNCLLQRSTQVRPELAELLEGGGGLCVLVSSPRSDPPITLSSLRFRECVSSNQQGHDVFFHNRVSADIPKLSFLHCDSTSSASVQRVFPFILSHLLPTPTDNATLTSFTITPLADSDTAEATIMLDKLASGEVLVLVDNAGRKRGSALSAPNIGRVLTFTFSSSWTASCVVSTGEFGLLQLPLSDYVVVATSVSHLPKTVSEISCELDESKTQAVLTLKGKNIANSVCSVVLHDANTFTASFEEVERGESVAKVNLGQIGQGTLSDEGTFEVKEVRLTHTNQSVVHPTRMQFTIPAAARLGAIVVGEFLDKNMTRVDLALTTVNLESNTLYTLTLVDISSGKTESAELSTDENGQFENVAVGLVHPNQSEREEEGEANTNDVLILPYDTTFTVQSLVAQGRTHSVLVSGISFRTPAEPSRVLSATCTTSKDSLIVTLNGVGFIVGEFYTIGITSSFINQSLSETPAKPIEVGVKATTPFSASSLALVVRNDDSTLRHNRKYTLHSISLRGVSGVAQSVIFEVPKQDLASSPDLMLFISIPCTLIVVLVIADAILFSYHRLHLKAKYRMEEVLKRLQANASEEVQEEVVIPASVSLFEEIATTFLVAQEPSKRLPLPSSSMLSNVEGVETKVCGGEDGLGEETFVDGLLLSRPSHWSERLQIETTLYDVLHSDDGLRNKRETEVMIVGGLAVLEASTMNKEVLAILSPHVLVFNKKMEFFIQLTSLEKETGSSDDENRTGMDFLAREGLRWGAPEQNLSDWTDAAEIDAHQVCVFRVGMLLFEIETGEIPFKYLNVIQAHRQVMMGYRPDLLKVTNLEMRGLIESCMAINPAARPTLPMIVTALEAVEEERKEDEDDDEDDWELTV
ncbi:hypothetical protein BLNAU_15000 [Blattamonas nauphoetae]|uniref:Serine-threonine/tyrosine-protein kinase catalytic domain-containing protein n=1 Tax=Blattamonas nauphoetae TaxID=2049346 RepID=A0ABQ9XC40_9EUKA|nr:hypothetical protein BLNAU_15000 [Blattamonas nauphoetae]